MKEIVILIFLCCCSTGVSDSEACSGYHSNGVCELRDCNLCSCVLYVNNTNCNSTCLYTVTYSRGSTYNKSCNVTSERTFGNVREIRVLCPCSSNFYLLPQTIQINGDIELVYTFMITQAALPTRLTEEHVNITQSHTAGVDVHVQIPNPCIPCVQFCSFIPVDFYLGYSNYYNPDQNGVYCVEYSFGFSRTFKSLRHDTIYDFYFKWRFVESTHWSEESVFRHKTLPDRPSAAPSFVKGGYSINNEDKLIIYWNRISDISVNGPELEYVLYKVDMEDIPSINSSLLNDLSQYEKLPYQHNITVNGSKLSQLLDKSFHPGDIIAMKSKNIVGISEEASFIQTSQSNPTWNTSFTCMSVNQSHYILEWQGIPLKHSGIWLLLCHGIHWTIQDWIECISEINIRKIKLESNQNKYIFHNEFLKGPNFCDRCNLQFGLVYEWNNFTSQIIWNITKSDETEKLENSSELSTTLIVVIVVVILLLVTSLCAYFVIPKLREKQNITPPSDIYGIFNPVADSGSRDNSEEDSEQTTQISELETDQSMTTPNEIILSPVKTKLNVSGANDDYSKVVLKLTGSDTQTRTTEDKTPLNSTCPHSPISQDKTLLEMNVLSDSSESDVPPIDCYSYVEEAS